MRLIAGLIAATLAAAPAAAQWEPNRPVQFVVPAGTGGGADQMARVIQGIVTKYTLMRQPIVVVNKAGGAGAEGFLEVKAARGNPHTIIISLSNLFTTPLATGIPFNWKDLTPVKMLALDEFVLWVHAEAPIRSVAEFVAAAGAQRLRMGGTGSRQEDWPRSCWNMVRAGRNVTATEAMSSALWDGPPATNLSRAETGSDVPGRFARAACQQGGRIQTIAMQSSLTAAACAFRVR
jgi:tripartite-type tricarboxylate transporter receptor subunit TctC